MTYLKKYGLRFIYTLGEILIAMLFITLFYYYNLIPDYVFKFLKLFVVLITIFINSFILGKSSEKKGYLEGLKFGLIIITFILIPTIVMLKFQIKLLIFYLIILSTTTLGGTVGINKKRIT